MYVCNVKKYRNYHYYYRLYSKYRILKSFLKLLRNKSQLHILQDLNCVIKSRNLIHFLNKNMLNCSHYIVMHVKILKMLTHKMPRVIALYLKVCKLCLTFVCSAYFFMNNFFEHWSKDGVFDIRLYYLKYSKK